MISEFSKSVPLISVFLINPFLAGSSFAEVLEVQIIKSAFIPHVVRIKKGDTVRWVNQDGLLHTVTSGKAPIHDGIFQGDYVIKEYKTTINESGWIDYFCALHNATMRELLSWKKI